MSHRYYEDYRLAKSYFRSRPSPPKHMVKNLLIYLGEKLSEGDQIGKWHLAIDVGAGSGQCTQTIRQYFDIVYGFDISEAQINEAKESNIYKNVQFECAPAENLPVEDKCADLITACQCLHWFDWNAFFYEARRVLKPNGVLAVIGHSMTTVQLFDRSGNNPINASLLSDAYNSETLKKYNEVNRHKYAENGYSDIEFPFKDVTRHVTFHEKNVTATECIDYVQSWSAYQRCIKSDPTAAAEFLDGLKTKFASVYNENNLSEIELVLKIKSYLVLGRN